MGRCEHVRLLQETDGCRGRTECTRGLEEGESGPVGRASACTGPTSPKGRGGRRTSQEGAQTLARSSAVWPSPWEILEPKSPAKESSVLQEGAGLRPAALGRVSVHAAAGV